MKRVLALVGALALTGLAGCHSDSKVAAAPVAPGNGALDGRYWKLSLSAKCDGDVGQCVAGYGFSLLNDGTFSVGPGPSGQTQTGNVGAEEFDAISQALDRVANAHLTEASASVVEYAETCQAPAEGEAADTSESATANDTLTLRRLGRDRVLTSIEAGKFCFRAQSVDDARALRKLVLAAATKYYALPFPDACADSAQALVALEGSLQGCSTDADCSYVSSSLDPIATGTSQFVTVDDCTRATPLSVGNAAALASREAELLKAINDTRTTCGARLVREDCTGVTGFLSSVAPPVCRSGSCQANPATVTPR
jgi:hypothetical protein